MSFNLDRYIR